MNLRRKMMFSSVSLLLPDASNPKVPSLPAQYRVAYCLKPPKKFLSSKLSWVNNSAGRERAGVPANPNIRIKTSKKAIEVSYRQVTCEQNNSLCFFAQANGTLGGFCLKILDEMRFVQNDASKTFFGECFNIFVHQIVAGDEHFAIVDVVLWWCHQFDRVGWHPWQQIQNVTFPCATCIGSGDNQQWPVFLIEIRNPNRLIGFTWMFTIRNNSLKSSDTTICECLFFRT